MALTFWRRPKPPALVRGVRVLALAEPSPRERAALAPLSAPGTVAYNGFVYYPRERERAWQSQQSRDDTILEMSNHPVIGGTLRQIAMFIRRVPWYVDPADDSQEAKDVATFYQDCLDTMAGIWPGDTMARILTFLAWGWSSSEVVYTRRDDGRIGWKYWRLIPQETRWRWEFGDDGEATALIQLDPQTSKEITIPLSRCIHIRDATRNNSPEGFSPLRLAWLAYFYREGFQQLEGTLFERYGGVQVARMPGADIKGNSPAYQEMQRIVTTVGINAQSGLVLASDRNASGNFEQDFEIKGPPAGSGVVTADPIINRYANEIVGVFGANVTRTGQDGTGSYALADVQGAVFQQNMAAYLDVIGDEITTQEFPRLARLNAIDPALVPKLRHGDIEDANLGELGAYIEALAKSGALVDSPELRVHLHEEAGLPVPTVEELRTQEKAQQAADAKAAQDALKAARTAQANGTVPGDGATPASGPTGVAGNVGAQNGNGAVVASERVRTLVEDDGALTLTDLLEVVQWFDAHVDESHRGMLNAKIVGSEG